MKSINIIIFSFMVSAIWSACIFNNKKSATKSNPSDSVPFYILDTLIVLEKSDTRIITRKGENYCENGQLATDYTDDTTYYQIINGQLTTWENGDCFKDLYSGTSTQINGTWSSGFQSIFAQDPTCQDTGGFAESNPNLFNPMATLNITDSIIVVTKQGGMCFSKMAQLELETDTPSEDDYTRIENIKSVGCNTLNYDMVFGNVRLPVSASFLNSQGYEIQMNMTMGSCSQIIPTPNFMQEPDNCNTQNASDSIFSETLEVCIFNFLFDQNELANYLSATGGFDSVVVINGNSFNAYDVTFNEWTNYTFEKIGNDLYFTMVHGLCSLQLAMDPKIQSADDTTAIRKYLQCIYGFQSNLKKSVLKDQKYYLPRFFNLIGVRSMWTLFAEFNSPKG